jgi:hypothetical protein
MLYNFFLSNATTYPLWTWWYSPPGCGRSVIDFWGWDAHEAQLRFPEEVDGGIWIWSTRRGLNLSSTKVPRPWSPSESSPSNKNLHGRTGNFFLFFLPYLFVFVFFVLNCPFASYRTACCGFFHYEKSDGFGRERTRDLGNPEPHDQ